MKKNNKTTVYFLLPAVVIIWGLIFYRIFGGLSADDIGQFSSKEVFPATKKEALSAPEFHLNLDYPDPFLGGRPVKKNLQKSVAIAPVMVQQGPIWPQIDYRGCVSNEKGAIAYLVVNGQVRLSGEGALKDDEIEILKIKEDSVLIGFEKERQWIKKL